MTDESWSSDEVHTVEANANGTEPSHLVYTLGGGSDCGKDNEPASITFDITCNPNKTGQDINFHLQNKDKCKIVITFEHETGCPVTDLGQFKSFL